MRNKFVVGQQFSRLPGHPDPDDKMRYGVLRLARTDSEWFRVRYLQSSGEEVERTVQLIAILRSLDSPEKFYISAHDADTPVNFFFHGVRSVTSMSDGRSHDIAQALSMLFDRPA